MRFKIKSTDISVSFSFLLSFLVCALADRLNLFSETLSASLIHETVHIILILLFKDGISEISFNIFGGKIKKANRKILSNNQEALINLCAPLFNIFLGLASLIFSRKCYWAYVNIFIGVFNILPFYSFDGGRAIFFLLCNKVELKTAKAIVYSMSFAVCLSFIALSVTAYIRYRKNIFFLIMSTYMIVSLFLFEKL
ncbi:MAG: hypothetical protein J6D06_02180 [Clostridia bacterium]|nr:hypothetical protein [Clostridia bacterium]